MTDRSHALDRLGRCTESTRVRRAWLAAALGTALALSAATVAAAPIDRIDRPAQSTAQAERLDLQQGRSLRFTGTGSGGIDRVVIPLTSATRANVGATDFTIELWLKGRVADNGATGCGTGDAAWITGNIVVDRDTFFGGDRGDFGLSLLAGRVAWGVSNGGAGATVCGTTNVLDGEWHHIAVTRTSSTGRLAIWVDGRLDAQRTSSPATGDVSYRVGRTTSYPADATLVIGAEKHDVGPDYPSFTGWVDEVRLSTTVRYTATFSPPATRFQLDGATAALYHFDAPSGTTVVDAVGTSPGTRRVGGPSNAPIISTDVPFP